MHEDDETKPTPDPDRAAILARRKQFIALALSGLATTTACTSGGDEARDNKSTQPDKSEPEQTKPQPCLTVSIDPPPEPPAPQVCLSVAPVEPVEPPEPLPPPEPVSPQVCLKIAVPDPEPQPETEPKPEPKPKPCLRKAAPKPCLKVAPPDDD